MEPWQKHWLDPRLLARNVREVEAPLEVLAPLRKLVPDIQALSRSVSPITLQGGLRLNRINIKGWNSDIAWLSHDDLASFRLFERVFQGLGLADMVAPHVAYDSSVVMYSGFFVTRSICHAPHFHRDWINIDNQAFTFLCPLSNNCDEIPLTYQNARGRDAIYQYQPGKGLLFGDGFLHSTAAGQSAAQTVMLSFTFGTDQMDRYQDMLKSAYQGPYHRRPDGVFVRDGVPTGD